MIAADRAPRLRHWRRPAGAGSDTAGRFASEVGYHVTLVKDVTAAFTREMMRAAHELNDPMFREQDCDDAELGVAL
jgi:nicotinamidase-related amidase